MLAHVQVETADIIRFNIRKTDIFARWGGEEFILMMPETTQENAELLSEKLRSAIEQFEFDTVDKVTASFGVTTYNNDTRIEDLIKRADTAMYRAKQSGRNQVCTLCSE